MSDFPLVSIITPTYNHKNFIGTCIESVLRQSFDAWEQIIIDDGSIDGTNEIIKTYKDSRIRFINQNHRGIWHLSEAYNTALKLARGEFIAILEGDDFWPADKLEKQIPYFDDAGVILTWGKGIIVDDKNQVIDEMMPKHFNKYKNIYQNIPIGIALNRLLFENFIVPTATIVIRRRSLIEVGGFEQPIGIPFVDYATWLKLCLRGRFCFINEVLGFWRRHRLQTSNLFNSEMILGTAEISSHFLDDLTLDQRKSYGINTHELMSMNAYLRGTAYHIKKDYVKSNKEFIKAIIGGYNLIRCKAFIGLLSNVTGIELFKLINSIKVKIKII